MKALLALLFGLCVLEAGADDLQQRDRYKLHFPPIALKKEPLERVVAIRVKVKCGTIDGILHIPQDWWLEQRGPLSFETTFSASAYRGAVWLPSLDEWNGSIVIVPGDMKCFDVSAGVLVDYGVDAPREVTLSRAQLRLRR